MSTPSSRQKHNGSGTAEYEAWKHLRKHHREAMDTTWASFATFRWEMGPKPTPRHRLGRLDPEGPFNRENCRWMTHAEAMRHQRRTVLITYGNRTASAAEWSRKTGIPVGTIYRRVEEGLTAEAVLKSTPLSEQVIRERRGG